MLLTRNNDTLSLCIYPADDISHSNECLGDSKSDNMIVYML